MGRLKKLKKIRIHREGTHILWASFLLLLLINAALYWGIDCKIPFYVVAVASIAVYLLLPLSDSTFREGYGENSRCSCRRQNRSH